MQLDLFDAGGTSPSPTMETQKTLSEAQVVALSDEAILAAIPKAGFPIVLSLVNEAGRRKLQNAIPVLNQLCRLFAGFGLKHEIAEQTAALQALAAIGGSEARLALARLLDQGVVQGPTLKHAVRFAAELRCRLSSPRMLQLLQHDDPEVRSYACDLARPQPDINAALLDLMRDLNVNVRVAAACALGRFGQQEAKAILKDYLQRAPTPKIVEAIASIDDPECTVLLGRVARSHPNLTHVVVEALKAIETPVAIRIVDELNLQIKPK